MNSDFIRIGDTTLYYETEKNIVGSDVLLEAVITGVANCGTVLNIPEAIDGKPVTKVDKKALMGQLSLRTVTFPESVRKFENWCMAQCKNLSSIVLMGEDNSFGKGVFDDCISLEHITIGQNDGSKIKEDHSILLAKAPFYMDAEYLLSESYSGYEEWFVNWDARLNSILHEADDEGYTALILCGEEDIIKNPQEYMRDNRKKKAYLSMLRLAHDSFLKDESRERYERYILDHIKGCETDESWQVILDDFAGDISYIRLYEGLGGITEANIDDMLKDMDEKFTEAKVYLMNYKQEKLSVDIFDSFAL